MSNYNDLKSQVPFLVSKDPVIDEIYAVQGAKFDELAVDKSSLLDQLFADSATWGIELWEEFLNIAHDVRKSQEERRNAIKGKLIGTKVFTIQMVKDIAKIFGYAVVYVQENVDPYTVTVRLTSATNFTQVRSFIDSINDLKPAHLSFIYLYNLSIWGDIEASMVDYATLDSYKWEDFLINGEGDGVWYTTNFLNLILWETDDVFYYKNFTDNFNDIDAKFSGTTGHTHNGEDSYKLEAEFIQYDTTMSVLDRMILIDDSISSTDGKLNVANAIGLPTVETDTYDKMANDIKAAKQSMATAITNKGVATSATGTLQSFADKIRLLPGTVVPAGTALSEEVLEGKTFVNNSGKQTGTAPLRSGINYIPQLSADWLIHGFHDGTCKILGDADLIPVNIRKDIVICGVTGTLSEPEYVDGSYIPTNKVQINVDGQGKAVSFTILP